MLDHLPNFQKYLRVLEGLQESSVKAYSEKITEFFSWLDGRLRAPEMRKNIEDYLEYCFYKGNTNQTRHTKLTALSKFFNYLRYEGLIAENPAANIPRPKLKKKMMQSFRKDEVLNIFKQINSGTEKGLRDICILILAAFCGFRVSEIYDLNLEDVIDDGKDIKFNILNSKGRDRRVDLWKVPGMFIRQYLMLRIFQGGRNADPFLVSYNHSKPKLKRLTACSIENLIKQLAQQSGIRRPTIKTHMLRAGHANDLQSIKGYTLTAIMERLGWGDLSTAGRYLVHRERLHREYASLHDYWREFGSLWKKAEPAEPEKEDSED